MLDPQAKSFLDQLASQNMPAWSEMPLQESRNLFGGLTELFGQGPEVQSVADQVVEGVGTRVYLPNGPGPHPGIVYFHGGGWVLGDLDTHDALCRRFAHEASCAVVSVDYRRAPENRYPAALEDGFTVTRCVAANPRRFSVDPHRLVLAGDSAGGSLALAVARQAKDRGGPDLRAQFLIYPVVDRRFETASYLEFSEGYGLTREAMIWFWDQYVGSDAAEPEQYLVPSSDADLSGLPPTHIVTAEFDVLRDEGEALAARLRGAGVPTTLRRYDGMIHGFVHFSGLFEAGRQAASEIADLMRESFAD